MRIRDESSSQDLTMHPENMRTGSRAPDLVDVQTGRDFSFLATSARRFLVAYASRRIWVILLFPGPDI